MRITLSFQLIFLFLSIGAEIAICNDDHSDNVDANKQGQQYEQGDCSFKCTKEWLPVCGRHPTENIRLIFNNPCTMELYNCLNSTRFVEDPMEACKKCLPVTMIEYDTEQGFFVLTPGTNCDLYESVMAG